MKRSQKDRHRDFIETEHRLRQEIEQLLKENTLRSRDLKQENSRLRAELEYGRSMKQPDVLKVCLHSYLIIACFFEIEEFQNPEFKLIRLPSKSDANILIICCKINKKVTGYSEVWNIPTR